MKDQSNTIDGLRKRYVSLWGVEPTRDDELERIQALLRVFLPGAFKKIAAFYHGGMLGGISHHAIAATGPADNIVDETLRLRTSGLAQSVIVLAEPPESLVVLDCDSKTVIWCDNTDVINLQDNSMMHNPKIWPSYAEFFSFLLKEEEAERA